MGLLDKLFENPITGPFAKFAIIGYSIVMDNLWSVSSSTILLSSMYLLVISQEKQLMADYMYGAPQGKGIAKLSGRPEMVTEAQKIFEAEVATGVKRDVWALPKHKFEQEYRSAGGDDLLL